MRKTLITFFLTQNPTIRPLNYKIVAVDTHIFYWYRERKNVLVTDNKGFYFFAKLPFLSKFFVRKSLFHICVRHTKYLSVVIEDFV